MRIKFTFLALLLHFSFLVFSQNVTINPSGITPAGLTYQRISYQQILLIPSPNPGDIVYDVTYNCLRVFNGSNWLKVLAEIFPISPVASAWSIETHITNIESDIQGNVYLIGNFQGTINIGGNLFTSFGDNDIFIAKYTFDGSLEWFRNAGSPAGDIVTDISIDVNGDLIIVGYYWDNINFQGNILPYSGVCNMFLVKYSSFGSLIWLKSAWGSGLKIPRGITTDSNGNIYSTGYFSGSVTFDGASDITLNSTGGNDAFISKFDSNGDVIWSKSISGSTEQFGKDIQVSGTNLFVSGSFFGYTNFTNSFSLTSTLNSEDIFLSKYNTIDGNFINAIQIGGQNQDQPSRFSIDMNGDILFAANVYSSIMIPGKILIPVGNSDCFFAKYNQNLNLVWANMFGGTLIDNLSDIKPGPLNTILLVGNFSNSITTNIGTVTSSGLSDVFVGKTNANGEFIWLEKYGGVGLDFGVGLSSKGAIYASGVYSGTGNFGTILSGGISNGFIMKLVE